MGAPAVSVLLPVFNGSRFLVQAIASILAQSLDDIELLVVDDGSTDGSPEMVKGFKDRRIRLMLRPHLGLVPALNYGLTIARSEWIARMDSDDVAVSERLVLQWGHVQHNPKTVVLGGAAALIDENGRDLCRCERPSYDHNRLLRDILTPVAGQSLIHPTVLMRKEAVLKVGGYRHEFPCCEDKDLWLRLSHHGELHSLPETVLLLRKHPESVSVAKERTQVVSGILAIVSHLVQSRTGVDLVADQHALFDLCWNEVARAVDTDRIVPLRQLRRAIAAAGRRKSWCAFVHLLQDNGARSMLQAISLPRLYQSIVATNVTDVVGRMPHTRSR